MKLFRLPTTVRIAINSVLLALVCVAFSQQAQAGRGGPDNTATGVGALHSNTTGSNNTATGYQSLYSNTTGSENVADGSFALSNNTTGIGNVAVGDSALIANTTATGNVAIGGNALINNLTGNGNTAVGLNAGSNLTTGHNNVDIGANVTGDPNEDNTIRIGNGQNATFIAGISGATVASGVGVVVGPDGHLGTIVSSRQFKDAIKPMEKASEAILALKPVMFRYKPNLDPDGIPQFGLVAEDVAKVNPDLVARDRNGKPYTVRYEAVNAMLLNEFLKAHRKIEDQQKHIDALEAQLKEQKALIQNVSTQLELRKSPTQAAANNR
jgi:trimeric autotransporter adhesin